MTTFEPGQKTRYYSRFGNFHAEFVHYTEDPRVALVKVTHRGDSWHRVGELVHVSSRMLRPVP